MGLGAKNVTDAALDQALAKEVAKFPRYNPAAPAYRPSFRQLQTPGDFDDARRRLAQGEHRASLVHATGGARGLSADGRIVVGWRQAGGHAFRWQAGDLTFLAALPGADASYAYDVSADGSVIVGRSFGDFGAYAGAVVWRDGEVARLPGFRFEGFDAGEDGWFEATGVSDDGETIVGHGMLPGVPGCSGVHMAGAIWNGFAVELASDHLPNTETPQHTQAFDCTSDGRLIVGINFTREQAAYWTGGREVLIGDLPGGPDYAKALAVSDDGGVIVGSSNSENGLEAFRWTAASGMVGLGFLPGGIASEATGVSGDGSVVVGWTRSPPGVPRRAFTWTEADGMRDLQEAFEASGVAQGWELYEARAISSDGRTIIGVGLAPGPYPTSWIGRFGDTCAADLDADGDVDLGDLSLMLGAFGVSGAGDLTCDEATDLDDLSILLGRYGMECP